jgi:hypothetical protein
MGRLSNGTDMRKIITPPKNKGDELSTSGSISLLLIDIITLLTAVATFPVRIISPEIMNLIPAKWNGVSY